MPLLRAALACLGITMLRACDTTLFHRRRRSISQKVHRFAHAFYPAMRHMSYVYARFSPFFIASLERIYACKREREPGGGKRRQERKAFRLSVRFLTLLALNAGKKYCRGDLRSWPATILSCRQFPIDKTWKIKRHG